MLTYFKASVQIFLIIAAVLCVPVMLLVKPTIIYCQHKKKSQVIFFKEIK